MPLTSRLSVMTLLLRGLIVGICMPFIVSGFTKLFDLAEAAQEMVGLSSEHAQSLAVLVVFVQLAGSMLAVFYRGVLAAVGALALAAFTAAATFLVHAFWNMQGDMRNAEINIFTEHVSITFALLMVAWGHAKSVKFAVRRSWMSQESELPTRARQSDAANEMPSLDRLRRLVYLRSCNALERSLAWHLRSRYSELLRSSHSSISRCLANGGPRDRENHKRKSP